MLPIFEWREKDLPYTCKHSMPKKWLFASHFCALYCSNQATGDFYGHFISQRRWFHFLHLLIMKSHPILLSYMNNIVQTRVYPNFYLGFDNNVTGIVWQSLHSPATAGPDLSDLHSNSPAPDSFLSSSGNRKFAWQRHSNKCFEIKLILSPCDWAR